MLKDCLSSSPRPTPKHWPFSCLSWFPLFYLNPRACHSSQSNMSLLQIHLPFLPLHKIPILDKNKLLCACSRMAEHPCGEKSHSLEEWFCFHFVISLLTGCLSCPEYISPYSHHSGLLFSKAHVSHLLFSLNCPLQFPFTLSSWLNSMLWKPKWNTSFLVPLRMSLRLSCSVAIILTSLWYLPILSLFYLASDSVAV